MEESNMARRSNGEGSITQRKDGYWQFALSVNGRRQIGYGKSEKEAKAKLLALQKQHAVTGTLPNPGTRTVNILLDLWMETVKLNHKPKTCEDYEKISKYIRKGIGHVRLSKLESGHIQNFYASLHQHGTRVPSRVHSVLHRALTMGVLWGWLATNPADRVLKPNYRAERKEIWTQDQLMIFLEGTQHHWLHPLWVLAISTGCRISEMVGLKWEDFNLSSAHITIQNNLQRIQGNWIETTPKTTSGLRTIALPNDAIQALHRQRAQQLEWQLFAGVKWQDYGLVFTGRFGQPLNQSIPQHAIKEECQRLGIPRVTPHGLRHLHASLLLSKGLPITSVSARLGHASPAITMQVYAHALKSQDIEAAGAIGRILSQQQ
jgi:integrase